jgi:hypothetical protein
VSSKDDTHLQTRLRETLATVHSRPGRIEHDDELRGILVALYDTNDPDELWSAVLGPYLVDQEAGLRNVWREHAADPSWSLLDHPEALLVFERADRDRERFRQAWPGPPSWLSRISDAWGIPL